MSCMVYYSYAQIAQEKYNTLTAQIKEAESWYREGTLDYEEYISLIEFYGKQRTHQSNLMYQWNQAYSFCENYGLNDSRTVEAVDKANEMEARTPEYEAQPPPTAPEIDTLIRNKEAVKDHYMALHDRGVLTMSQALAAIKAAQAALEAGEDMPDAMAAGDKAAEEAKEVDPTQATTEVLGRFGDIGDLAADTTLGAKVIKHVQDFMATLGLSVDRLQELKGSPIDRDKAAELASAISIGAQTGLGLLYSVGVLAEVASFGQIDKVVDTIDYIVKNMGIDEILKPLFNAPFYAALTIPVRQYWMREFTPTVPEIQDLRTMAVREAFDVDTREAQFTEMQKWASYHGLDAYWTERYLKAGFMRMDVDTGVRMRYWRLWNDTQLRRFLAIADIHPDDHEAILATMWRTPSRYERRHGFIMGRYSRDDLVGFFQRDGLNDLDSLTATEAMTAYALNAERNAVARAAGRIYRRAVINALVYIESQVAVAQAAVAADELTQDEADQAVEMARQAAGQHIANAEGAFRGELSALDIITERQEHWVRRYYLEAWTSPDIAEAAVEEGGEMPPPQVPPPTQPPTPPAPTVLYHGVTNTPTQWMDQNAGDLAAYKRLGINSVLMCVWWGWIERDETQPGVYSEARLATLRARVTELRNVGIKPFIAPRMGYGPQNYKDYMEWSAVHGCNYWAWDQGRIDRYGDFLEMLAKAFPECGLSVCHFICHAEGMDKPGSLYDRYHKVVIPTWADRIRAVSDAPLIVEPIHQGIYGGLNNGFYNLAPDYNWPFRDDVIYGGSNHGLDMNNYFQDCQEWPYNEARVRAHYQPILDFKEAHGVEIGFAESIWMNVHGCELTQARLDLMRLHMEIMRDAGAHNWYWVYARHLQAKDHILNADGSDTAVSRMIAEFA